MFIAALFTVTKMWTPPDCPFTDDWIKSMRYIYAVEHYSAVRKDEILPFMTTWRDLRISC